MLFKPYPKNNKYKDNFITIFITTAILGVYSV